MQALTNVLLSFKTLIDSVTGIMAATTRLIIILEIAYLGYMVAVGKMAKANEIVLKLLSMCIIIFVVASLPKIAEEGRLSVSKVAEKIIERNSDGKSNVDFNPDNPFSSAMSLIKDLLDVTWRTTEEYIVSGASDTKGLGVFETISVTIENAISQAGRWFIATVIRIVNLGFIMIILYSVLFYFVALLEYYVILTLSSVFIAFYYFQHTKFIADGCFKAILGQVIKVGTLHLILGITFALVKITTIRSMEDGMMSISNNGFVGGITIILTQVILAFAIYMIIQSAPGLATSFITGSPGAMNPKEFSSFAAKGVALATGGAAIGATVGRAANDHRTAANIGKGAFQAASQIGGASAGKQAQKEAYSNAMKSSKTGQKIESIKKATSDVINKLPKSAATLQNIGKKGTTEALRDSNTGLLTGKGRSMLHSRLNSSMSKPTNNKPKDKKA